MTSTERTLPTVSDPLDDADHGYALDEVLFALDKAKIGGTPLRCDDPPTLARFAAVCARVLATEGVELADGRRVVLAGDAYEWLCDEARLQAEAGEGYD